MVSNICEATGVELELKKGSPWSVEIDRIKVGGDYTMDNCRLVCAIYNRARWTFSDNDVRIMSNALIKG